MKVIPLTPREHICLCDAAMIESTALAVLVRARERFLAGGKNGNLLTAIDDAAAQLNWEDIRAIYRVLRNSTRAGDGADWRLTMLDRAIQALRKASG